MKKIIIPALLLGSACLSAQSAGQLRTSFINNIKSPQATDFTRHGNIPIKKSIGELDVSIPLLSIPTQDGNNIGISLAYNASGFIPSKKSGLVGFNWSLIAGGAITREVRGEADDQIGSPQTLNLSTGHFEHGLLVGLRQFNNNPVGRPNDNDIFNYNNGKVRASIDTNQSMFEMRFRGNPDDVYTPFETTSDIYSFNFNGISGKFFISSTNDIRVITDEPHKLAVDLDGVNAQQYTGNCTPLYSSEIKITDEKGNKYYFGGESKNIEYSVYLGGSAGGLPSGGGAGPVINSWQLTKIEFPNGETIKYNYLDDQTNFVQFCNKDSTFWHSYAETKKFIDFNIHVNSYAKFLQSNETFYGSYYAHVEASSTVGQGNTYSLTKKTYLSNIEFKDTKIIFNYSDQDNIFKNLNIFEDYPSNNSQASGDNKFKQKKIDNIVVNYKSNMVNKIDFNYSVPNTQYPRIFLTSVKEQGKNPYVLNYDTSNSSNTPIPSTRALDYWGFYNGKLTNDNSLSPKLTPGADYQNNGDFNYTSDIREPNFSFSKMYALSSVQYPTKGSSSFIYEPHVYSKRLERRSTSAFLPSLFDVDGISGGTRIKSITDINEGQNENTREFSYSNDSNLSSGVLMDWPRYYFYMTSLTTNQFCENPVTLFNHTLCTTGGWSLETNQKIGFVQSSGFSKNLYEGSVINYAKVTENYIGKGSEIDYFTTYIDRPDIFSSNIRQLTEGTYAPMPIVQNIFLMPGDLSIERGKLYNKKIFNEGGTLLEEQDFAYNEDTGRFNKFHYYYDVSNAHVNTPKSYFYQNYLSTHTIKKFLNGQTVLSEVKKFYSDVNNMLIKKTEKMPDQQIQETNLLYAFEKNNSLMIIKNMLGIPLEINTVKRNNTADLTGKVTSRQETLYPVSQAEADSHTSGLVLPKSEISYELQNNLPSTDVTYDSYDNKGNLQQFTGKDGVSTTIIWGYNQTLPVAKITGAKFSDIPQSIITSIVNTSNADAAAAVNNDESALLLALDNFRNHTSLANYQVTTYSYDPLVGIRSITPPSGIREVYLYDTANRLKEVRQDNATGKLLKEFKYNYKN